MFGDKEKVHVYIGGDHAGFEVKNALHAYLETIGFDVTDLGCFTIEPCDYPDIAREVGEKVQENGDSFGILICGSGIGVSIAANKVKGIRAVLATEENVAELARMHNNANVLTMGARIMDIEKMKKVAEKFLTTAFDSEERHVRRVEKLNSM